MAPAAPARPSRQGHSHPWSGGRAARAAVVAVAAALLALLGPDASAAAPRDARAPAAGDIVMAPSAIAAAPPAAAAAGTRTLGEAAGGSAPAATTTPVTQRSEGSLPGHISSAADAAGVPPLAQLQRHGDSHTGSPSAVNTNATGSTAAPPEDAGVLDLQKDLQAAIQELAMGDKPDPDDAADTHGPGDGDGNADGGGGGGGRGGGGGGSGAVEGDAVEGDDTHGGEAGKGSVAPVSATARERDAASARDAEGEPAEGVAAGAAAAGNAAAAVEHDPDGSFLYLDYGDTTGAGDGGGATPAPPAGAAKKAPATGAASAPAAGGRAPAAAAGEVDAGAPARDAAAPLSANTGAPTAAATTAGKAVTASAAPGAPRSGATTLIGASGGDAQPAAASGDPDAVSEPHSDNERQKSPPPSPSPRTIRTMVYVTGTKNESCLDACAAVQLSCVPDAFAAINTCEAMHTELGCDGGCLQGTGPDKPALVKFAEYPVPVCFVNSEPEADDSRPTCSATSTLSRRMCPCTQSEAQKQREDAARARSIQRLEKVSESVVKLLDDYNKTQTGLVQAAKTLEVKEQEVKALKDEADREHIEEGIAAALRSGQGKVDYVNGRVTLGDGRVLTFEEAARVTQLVSERQGGGKGGGESADTFHDPAALVYDARLLQDVGVLLCAAALGGLAASKVGLPASFGYILSGAVVGPNGLAAITQTDRVAAIAQFGSMFPLFANGMSFRTSNLLRYLRVSVGGTLLCSAAYTLVLTVLGYKSGFFASPVEGLLVGLSTSLASPGVATANLDDSGMMARSSGNLAMGILAVQSLVMGLLLSVPHGLSSDVSLLGVVGAFVTSVLAFTVVMGGGLVLSRTALPSMVANFVLQDSLDETLHLLGLVALCFAMALATDSVGLSLEMGAFVAGLMVTVARGGDANKRRHGQHKQQSHRPSSVLGSDKARVEPLSLVFGALFFASIGMRVSPVFMWYNLGLIVQTFTLVLGVKLTLMTAVITFLGLPSHIAMAAAVPLAQITEYSLIFTGKAHAMGVLSRHTYLLWLTSAVLSLVASPVVMRLASVMFSELRASRTALKAKQRQTQRQRARSGGTGSSHSSGASGASDDYDGDASPASRGRAGSAAGLASVESGADDVGGGIVGGDVGIGIGVGVGNGSGAPHRDSGPVPRRTGSGRSAGGGSDSGPGGGSGGGGVFDVSVDVDQGLGAAGVSPGRHRHSQQHATGGNLKAASGAYYGDGDSGGDGQHGDDYSSLYDDYGGGADPKSL